jgi:hypothetical protein
MKSVVAKSEAMCGALNLALKYAPLREENSSNGSLSYSTTATRAQVN